MQNNKPSILKSAARSQKAKKALWARAIAAIPGSQTVEPADQQGNPLGPQKGNAGRGHP